MTQDWTKKFAQPSQAFKIMQEDCDAEEEKDDVDPLKNTMGTLLGEDMPFRRRAKTEKQTDVLRMMQE